MKRIVLLFLPMLFMASRVHAEYFTITGYHVSVTFSDEGHADFEEVIEVHFSEQRHGIFRVIPIRSKVDGKTVDRIIRNIEVDGFDFSTSKENHNLTLKIGNKNIWVDGRQTYRLRYRVLNPLNFFEEHAEFYWDLLGIAWPVVVEEFAFELNFPGGIRLTQEDVRCFTGQAGRTESNATFQVFSNGVEGKTTQKFMPEEGLTVAVRLPKSAFKPMDARTYFLERHGLLLAPVFLLVAGFFSLFSARNRKQTIMTEYFPPDGISPAIAGGFVDHSVDHQDVLCLIPHLANQGYLRLELEEGGFLKKGNIVFFKLKEAGPELMSFEKQFFNALFSTGEEVNLKDLKDKFYMHLSAVQLAVKNWIELQGWYEANQKKMGFIAAIAGFIAIGWGAYAIFAQQNLDGLALIVTGLILFYFASRFNKRSPEGNETYRRLEGFRQFVKRAERPVIERLMKDDPLYYDKTMPYALAFGYLKQWNKHFEGLLSQPPSWYSSPGMYGSHSTRSWNSFSENFPSEINQISSVFNSSPNSSSSGGGGSSGGGSGGGGGGSW